MGNRRTTAIASDAEDAELVDRYQRLGEPEVLEALIGLYKAVRDFRPDHQASFRAFAELCIKRQIITAIKTATRQKHQPLNQYQSISGVRPGDEAGEAAIDEILVCHAAADPCETVVADERMASMQASMDRLLSSLEVEVLRLYVEGKSYQEISDQLGRHTKSIDNALQRIKRKVESQIVLTDEA